ncbi:hypothetical protein JYB64_10535 [Algoriphagus aestuarii]|nr:hypothetical protein [Algoriphagus aestuarii]
MIDSYKIEIHGLKNLNDFVEAWSPMYSYPLESKYRNNISKGLINKDSFIELFKWKNGTGNTISGKKLNTALDYWGKVEVLKELKVNFDWSLFENEFEPQKSSTIWKLFLLHIMKPSEFPIFDQHVYRSFLFFKEGIIKEIPSNSRTKYLLFKHEYLGWFNKLKNQYNASPKMMDESFFSFGQMLKGIKKYPIRFKPTIENQLT